MADPKPKKTQGTVRSGVVQMSFPAAGFCLVVPAGPTVVDKPIVCKLNTVGGLLGGGVLQAPPAGTFVTYTVVPGSDKAYLVSTNPQGCEPRGYMQELNLNFVTDFVPQMSSCTFVKGLLQHVQDSNKHKEHATANVGLQDQYEGDLYQGDRYGPGIFNGRAQITIKGSDLSYIEMASTEDKINVLTAAAQLDGFADKITITPDLTKVLKASGATEGLGGRYEQGSQFPLTMQNNVPSTLKYKHEDQKPLFRSQTFEGGAAQGTYKTTVAPTVERPAAVASDMLSYDGQHMAFFAQGTSSIKTLAIPGLQDKPFQFLPQTEKGQDEQNQRQLQAEETVNQLKDRALSQDGRERALQLNKILQDDFEKALISFMLGNNVADLIKEGVEPFDSSLKSSLQDWDRQLFQLGQQFFTDGPKTADKNAWKENVTRCANTSFITQDPDGTITLKDGWGSQITMSHGNIYISSALDTFIRPGRNLIGMIPQHMSLAANGEIELAAKKDIKIGAEKNLQLASAISGEDGYTVLQNRSKNKGDMVIRSNGKLTITSSDDMHIGSNDKRTNNSKDWATEGHGSIFIQGEGVRVQSRRELRLSGAHTGIFASNGYAGTGIQISNGDISIISPILNMDTGSLRIGGFQGDYKIVHGLKGDSQVQLRGGTGATTVHVNGQLKSRGLFIGGAAQISGPIVGSDYMRWSTEEQKTIPGTKKTSIDIFRKQVNQTFGKVVSNRCSNFRGVLQQWYDDNYICNKEFTFTDKWTATQMPTMCWQMLPQADQGYEKLKSISVTATGSSDKITMAYPGNSGWQSCKMSVIDENYEVKYEGSLADYKTFTKGE